MLLPQDGILPQESSGVSMSLTNAPESPVPDQEILDKFKQLGQDVCHVGHDHPLPVHIPRRTRRDNIPGIVTLLA